MRPDLSSQFGEIGLTRCREDAKYHLDALSQAIAVGRPNLFLDYVAWANIMLSARGISLEDLVENLDACRETLVEVLPPAQAAVADRYLHEALDRLPELPTTSLSYVWQERPLGELVRRFLDALLDGDRRQASQIVMDAIRHGTSIRDIYLHVFQRSQYEIGRLWQCNKISVAQEHLCTAATQMIMSQLYPLIFAAERKNRRMVASCVGGDRHEIGIRMVAEMFEMAGWDTYCLGADVPSASIVQTVIERDAQVLAISTTLTTHITAVADLIAEVRANPASANVKVLAGGHPFNISSDLWQEVGADGHAADALQAVNIAEQLLLADAVPDGSRGD